MTLLWVALTVGIYLLALRWWYGAYHEWMQKRKAVAYDARIDELIAANIVLLIELRKAQMRIHELEQGDQVEGPVEEHDGDNVPPRS